jgi:hypothetical protein
MGRRLFTISSVLSLLLFLAFTAGWLDSLRGPHAITWISYTCPDPVTRIGRQILVGHDRGIFQFQTDRRQLNVRSLLANNPDLAPDETTYRQDFPEDSRIYLLRGSTYSRVRLDWTNLGFGYEWNTERIPERYSLTIFHLHSPIALPMLLSAILPALWLRRYLRHRRRFAARGFEVRTEDRATR